MQWNVTVEGATNHAGTTPMDRRRDAMVGAARFVDAVYRTARTLPGRHVATVGRFDGETGTGFAFDRFYVSRAAPTDPRIRDVVERSARDPGLSTLRMPSGAGHDAQSIALLAPVGIIFVPPVDGISHAPEERTLPGDVTNGADVLLRTLLALDEGRWRRGTRNLPGGT